MKPLKRAEAERLAGALMRQLRGRLAVMKIEAQTAFGHSPLPKSVLLPHWVTACIHICFTGTAELKLRKFSAKELVEALGAANGMAKSWNAFLSSPSSEMSDLENRFPLVTEMRLQLQSISKPSLTAISRADRKIDSARLKPELWMAYLKGTGEGAAEVLDESGELVSDTTIRQDVCYLIWLYWPDIQRLNSVTDLEKFFRDMRQDDVTRKNLEKICREIRLKFKSRGRPKNLFH